MRYSALQLASATSGSQRPERILIQHKHFLTVGGHRHSNGLEVPMADAPSEPCQTPRLECSSLSGRKV